MKMVLLILVVAVIVLVVVIGTMAATITIQKRKIAERQKILDGINDPMVWLSDEDRRDHALELLERERARYQDDLYKQVINPTQQKKEPNQ